LARQDTMDPRVTRTRQVVLTAVIEELAAVGHADFTIESVAARCGVGKSTIYRHWDGKLQLIVDAIHELNTQPAPEPEGTPRERIRQLLHHLGHALTEGSLAPAIPALIEAAERDRQVRALLNDYTVERRRALVDALTLGIDEGQVDASTDPELAAQALSGAIFYARLMTTTPLTETAIDQLIDTMLGPD
jgi:TetR/AcrR family transcriptional regulator, regulator of autoinduction and epiphytic fitness